MVISIINYFGIEGAGTLRRTVKEADDSSRIGLTGYSPRKGHFTIDIQGWSIYRSSIDNELRKCQ